MTSKGPREQTFPDESSHKFLLPCADISPDGEKAFVVTKSRCLTRNHQVDRQDAELPGLSYTTDQSPPGSSVHGTLQASVLEQVAISFSRGSS